MSFFENQVLIELTAVITTSGSLVTLVSTSNARQIFTGSTAQTVKLPVGTTLVKDQRYEFVNLSSATMTIEYQDATTATTIPAGTVKTLLVNDVTTSNGTWQIIPYGGGSSASYKQEVLVGSVDGSNTVFTTSQLPQNSNQMQVFKNGIFQILGVNYTYAPVGGVGQITFTAAPSLSDEPSAAYAY